MMLTLFTTIWPSNLGNRHIVNLDLRALLRARVRARARARIERSRLLI